MKFFYAAAAIAFALVPLSASAADYPAPKEGAFVARDFKFHTGEVIPELQLHYTTIGESSGQPVLILHGTAGSGAQLEIRTREPRRVERAAIVEQRAILGELVRLSPEDPRRVAQRPPRARRTPRDSCYTPIVAVYA